MNINRIYDNIMASGVPVTVITGCNLTDGNFWSHGDLWALNGNWIFNSVSIQHEWTYHKGGQDMIRGEKALIMADDCPFFWRRGVFVIPRSSAYLNQLALEYVARHFDMD